MVLYLDSAMVADARRSAALGYVVGVTTNPTLVSRTGRPASDVLVELCDVHPGPIFYQPVATTVAQREAEARRMAGLCLGRIVLKLPSTPENFELASRLGRDGLPVGMTAIFSPGQVYLACAAGARYVLPYVNRSTRLLGDGPGLVRSMRQVIDALAAPTQIVAASIKSPAEAVDALLAGAHALTLPLEIVEQLGRHDLSDQAIAEFAESARAIPREA